MSDANDFLAMFDGRRVAENDICRAVEHTFGRGSRGRSIQAKSAPSIVSRLASANAASLAQIAPWPSRCRRAHGSVFVR